MNEKLIELIEEYNPNSSSINDYTRLYHDLNIHGDDASELMAKYSELFMVDIKEFNFSNYFPNEGDPILPGIIRKILRKPSREYKELTVANLNKGIDTRALK